MSLSPARSVFWLMIPWAIAVVLRVGSPIQPRPADGSFLGLLLVAASPGRHATWAWWNLGRNWVQNGSLPPERFRTTVHQIGADDPTWRTPWTYAGLMLQTQGNGPAADPLLREAAQRWPTDPWFPAALGVSLQDQDRVDEAREWLNRARVMP